MAPQSELQFGTSNCVSLCFRQRKPKSGIRFGVRLELLFRFHFELENCADNKVSCFLYFFWIDVPRKLARSEM